MKDIFELNYDDVLVSDKDIKKYFSDLTPYIKKLRELRGEGYDAPESFINLPADSEMLGRVRTMIDEKKTDDLKYVVVVGIGGSNLGTMAIYKALRAEHLCQDDELPQMVFAETVDPGSISEISSILSKEVENATEIALCLVSKSGSTMETIANFELLYSTLGGKLDNINDRIVVITDEGSDLWSQAQKKEISILSIPAKVGGRFSVFSPVGLFPLGLVDIDIESLLGGADSMHERCFSQDVSNNIAAASAACTFSHWRDGRDINVNFFFNSALKTTGLWWRQLVAESLGKKYNSEGEQVNMGLTPIVSIGSTDLHSMAQLYFEGPKDKFYNLVYAQEEGSEVDVPANPFFVGLTEGIYGQPMREVMTSIYGGVKQSFREEKMPFTEIVMENISAYDLGAYMQFKMLEIVYLAKLLNINAFNQPGVEMYKEATRRLLADRS